MNSLLKFQFIKRNAEQDSYRRSNEKEGRPPSKLKRTRRGASFTKDANDLAEAKPAAKSGFL
jgi:hypothetical protein